MPWCRQGSAWPGRRYRATSRVFWCGTCRPGWWCGGRCQTGSPRWPTSGPTRDESLKAVVQAAVAGLLAQLGPTVTGPSDDGDLIVLPQEQSERRGRAVPR